MKPKRNVSFLEARRIVGSYVGESSYTSVAREADRTNDDTKYRTLVEKLIKMEANDWPQFQEHMKNYTRLNFTKHQLSKNLQKGKDPILLSKQKHT